MKNFLLALVLALAGVRAQAAAFSAQCAPDQVSILCPQTLGPDTTNYWTANNGWTKPLVDVSSNPSVDLNNRTLLDSTGLVPVADWAARTLFESGSIGVLTWGTQSLYDNTGQIAAGWGTRELNDTIGTVSLDWAGRTLHDTAGNQALAYNNRWLLTSGVIALDWSARLGNDSSNIPSFDWEGRLLIDGVGQNSVKWYFRTLHNSSGVEVMEWTGPDVVFSAAIQVNGTNIVYYCSGSTSGTFDGNLARGNSNAAACAGGTWTATSLKVD